MSLTTERFRKLAVLASGAALATGVAPALQGATTDLDLRVDGVSTDGDLVGLTLWNLGSEPRSGIVWIRARLADGTAVASSRFVLSTGQKVFVQMRMASPVQGIIQLGTVLDDGAPF